jgi:NitT/TauT family transport system permease protein
MTSFQLNAAAILWSTGISLLLAYLTVIPFFRPIVDFIGKLRFLSMVGLSLVFILMTSSPYALKLSLLVFSICVFFVTSMADVLASIPKYEYDLARTLKMSEGQVVWETVVLGQFDKVFDVLRQNAAIGWLMLTMVEGMSRSDGGIGAMLLNQNKQFKLDAVMAIQLLILVIGLGQDWFIGYLKKIFCPYATLTTKK